MTEQCWETLCHTYYLSGVATSIWHDSGGKLRSKMALEGLLRILRECFFSAGNTCKLGMDCTV